jgi:TRAP-type transport system periplasmic protein
MNHFGFKIVRAALSLLAVGSLVGVPAAGAAEKAVRINLGTLAPRGSVYHQSLQAMAEEWRKAPGGGVKLVIYPDGTQGGEADMVRLMNVETLQAGLLTGVGLAKIEPGVIGLQSIPMLFRDLDEFTAVSEKVRPTLEKRLLEKGYVVLFWVDAGWVRFFFKKPVNGPEEMKTRKMFAWAGDVNQLEVMKQAGYTPVPLETGDILPGLKTGLIDTVAAPPIFALAGQMDLSAPHMLRLNWAPLVGACVVRKSAWEKIPAATREVLLAAAAKAGQDIRANSRRESDEAVAAMQKRGLKVHEVSPEQVEKWRAVAEQLYPSIRGRIVPADIFDEVRKLVKERHAAGGGQ